jgi:hypothetical protein
MVNGQGFEIICKYVFWIFFGFLIISKIIIGLFLKADGFIFWAVLENSAASWTPFVESI